ncbi:TOBE domain-containing protein, partial [Rugosimonospora africana]|uniref:TOBE domain-containing protein n=1 Tax=Rugosimonospora africana TaxID=556532 RepID=UPI001941A541
NSDLVGESDGGMPILVDLVEELGSDAYVYGHVNLNGADERFVVRIEDRNTPQMGDTVHVKPRAGKLHVFHAATGLAI